MKTVKLHSSGKVILKDGKVSCGCCGTTLYVQYTENPLAGYGGSNPYPFGPEVLSYFTMTGTVGAGFTGTGPGGTFTLVYDIGAGRWFMTDPVYGISGAYFGSTNPANPASFYYDNGFLVTSAYAYYYATVSLTPFFV